MRVLRVEQLEDTTDDDTDGGEPDPLAVPGERVIASYVVGYTHPATGELITLRVPAERARSGEWLADLPEMGVKYESSPRGRSRVWDAIRETSPHAEVVTMYKSTGWHHLGEKGWAYIHSGGGITAAGNVPLAVRLPGAIAQVDLPDPVTDAAAVRALFDRDSRAMMTRLPPRVGAVLAGTAYRAVLGWLGSPTMVFGERGSYKSAAAALAMHHFGTKWDRQSPTASMSGNGSTFNSVRDELWAAKDAVFFADDWAPDKGVDAAASLASQFARMQYNRERRDRLNSKTKEIDTGKRTRCTALGTSEVKASTTSGNERLNTLDVARGEMDLADILELDAMASRRGRAQVMASLLSWMAGDVPGLQEWAKHRAGEISQRRREAGAPDRVAEPLAELEVGWELMARFLVAAGAYEQAEADTMLGEVREALTEAGDRSQDPDSPTSTGERCRQFIAAALRKGTIHLTYPGGVIPEYPEALQYGHRIDIRGGRNDLDSSIRCQPLGEWAGVIVNTTHGQRMHVEPSTVISTILSAVARAGEQMPVTRTVIQRELAAIGVLRTGVEVNKSTGRVETRYTVPVPDPAGGDKQHRMWDLDADKILFETGPSTPPLPFGPGQPCRTRRVNGPDGTAPRTPGRPHRAARTPPRRTRTCANSPTPPPSGPVTPHPARCAGNRARCTWTTGACTWCAGRPPTSPPHRRPRTPNRASGAGSRPPPDSAAGRCTPAATSPHARPPPRPRRTDRHPPHRRPPRSRHATPRVAGPQTTGRAGQRPAGRPESPWHYSVVVIDPDGIYLPDGTVAAAETISTIADVAAVGERFRIGHPTGPGLLVLTSAMVQALNLVPDNDFITRPMDDGEPVSNEEIPLRMLRWLAEQTGFLSNDQGWETTGPLAPWNRIRRDKRTFRVVLEPYVWIWDRRTDTTSPFVNLPDADTEPVACWRELARRLERLSELLGIPWSTSPGSTGESLFSQIQWGRERDMKRRHERGEHDEQKDARVLTAAVPLPVDRLGHGQRHLEWEFLYHPEVDKTELSKATVLQTYDRRGSYLSSAGGIDLGFGAVQHLDQEAAIAAVTAARTTPKVKIPFGMWQVTLPPWNQKSPPPHPDQHPYDKVQRWVTTPTLTLLLEDEDTGGAGYDLPDLNLTEAYVQQHQARLLEPWYARCRDALLTARSDGDEAIARAIKGVYTGYIGRMSSDFTRKGAQPWHHQPMWGAAIRAAARAALWRVIQKHRLATGRVPIAIEFDEIAYLGTDPDPRVNAPAADNGRLGALKSAGYLELTDTLRRRAAKGESLLDKSLQRLQFSAKEAPPPDSAGGG